MLIIAATAYAGGSYADVVRTKRAVRGISGLRPMADGDHYTILKGRAVVRCSYADRKDSVELFRASTDIADYALSADGGLALFADAASVKRIYRHSYTADYALATAERCEPILAGVRDVHFSPDGAHLAYAKQNNLYIYDIATRHSTAITSDGEWNSVINGTSDWVYEEEYGFTCGYAFSPDGSRIAYLRFDESRVPMFEMMRYDATLYNKA